MIRTIKITFFKGNRERIHLKYFKYKQTDEHTLTIKLLQLLKIAEIQSMSIESTLNEITLFKT